MPLPGAQLLPPLLAVVHSWAVHDVAYGTPLPVAVPVPAAAPGLRLLCGDDASLFLMATGPLGDGAAVSEVLVRATASPPALPRYTCTFYANPPPGAADLEGGYFFATVPVRSSALADGTIATSRPNWYRAM